jgi:HSP20 family protein
MDQMQREMDRFWRGNPLGFFERGVFPAMNVYDDGESFTVRAELPGVDPKDIDITVTGNTISLRGNREIEDHKDATYHRRERRSGSFRRALALPEQVDATKVQARSHDGILEVLLPRAEQAKMKKITVKAG